MSKSNAARSTTEIAMTTKTLVPADPLSPLDHAAWAMPRLAIDPSRCPVDHALRGPALDYLSAAPTDAPHLPDGTLNYEGFFRHQLHDLHREGNYRVFCD